MGRLSYGPRKQVNVRLPLDLIERIDTARGVLSRDLWMEKAAGLALGPIAQAREPDLKPKMHQHYFDTLSHTTFRDGAKQTFYRCDCGEEEAR